MIDGLPWCITLLLGMSTAPLVPASALIEPNEGVSVADASAAPASSAAGRARLERMFHAHHQLVWRVLRRLGLAPDGATDMTQQVFLIAAERLTDIRPESERAFLLGTALRLARSWRRKHARWDLEDDIDLRPASTEGEQKLVNRQTALQLLDRILSRMHPDLVTVFTLFELEGMSLPEIAELTSVPLGTATSRLRRARLTFRDAAQRLALADRSKLP